MRILIWGLYILRKLLVFKPVFDALSNTLFLTLRLDILQWFGTHMHGCVREASDLDKLHVLPAFPIKANIVADHYWRTANERSCIMLLRAATLSHRLISAFDLR